MKLSANGIKFIQDWEQCRLKAYLDTGRVWTIGWGHTQGVFKGMTCTQLQADTWFDEDTDAAERAVNEGVTVGMNQNQFDALVSFAYNCGVGAFLNSTLLKKFNAGDVYGASLEFLRWIHDNGNVVAGLVHRRNAERRLFLTPLEEPCPPPSPLPALLSASSCMSLSSGSCTSAS